MLPTMVRMFIHAQLADEPRSRHALQIHLTMCSHSAAAPASSSVAAAATSTGMSTASQAVGSSAFQQLHERMLGRLQSLRSAGQSFGPLQRPRSGAQLHCSGGPQVTCSATDQQQQQRMAGSGSNGSGPDGRDAGNNPVGLTIKALYGVGGPHTIRWGLLKRPVEPVAQVMVLRHSMMLQCHVRTQP